MENTHRLSNKSPLLLYFKFCEIHGSILLARLECDTFLIPENVISALLKEYKDSLALLADTAEMYAYLPDRQFEELFEQNVEEILFYIKLLWELSNNIRYTAWDALCYRSSQAAAEAYEAALHVPYGTDIVSGMNRIASFYYNNF